MPLITFVGIPLSGKTKRANELARAIEKYISNHSDELQAKGTPLRSQVIVVNDESLNIDKRTGYSDVHVDANAEKKSRGALMSAVERYVSKEQVVILDATNYIKGYRYQLYCIARGLATPSCTVFCGLNTQESLKRNEAKPTYDADILENLCSRMEEPDEMNRWDAPLFITVAEDEPLDKEGHHLTTQIISAALLRKSAAPNLSTIVKPLTETNYLHEMEKTIGDIVNAVIEAQKNGRMGSVGVPCSSKKVHIPSRMVTLSELRRYRREFTNINKLHTQLGIQKIADGFVDYLNIKLD